MNTAIYKKGFLKSISAVLDVVLLSRT